MNTLWLIFEIAVNFFQGWMYTFFVNMMLHKKPGISLQKRVISQLITISGIGIFLSLYLWLDLPITDSVTFIFTFIYSLNLSLDKWYISLLWNAIACAIMVMVCSVTASIYINMAGVSMEMINSPSLLRLSFVLLANINMFLTYFIVAMLKPHREHLSWGAVVLFILLNGVSLLAIEMQYTLCWQVATPQRPVLITIFSLLGVIVISLAIFVLLSKKVHSHAEMVMRLQSSEILDAHLSEIRVLYENMIEMRHDMKHQLMALEGMIENGDIYESAAYLANLKERIHSTQHMSGYVSLDALLTAKMAHMRSLGIVFEYDICSLKELPISETDFCAIIGNLLDNAVEAVSRMDAHGAGPVNLRISRVRGVLFIMCSNPVGTDKLEESGNGFISSKRKNSRGYGIPSIKRIVNQAEGICTFEITNFEFVADLSLPYYNNRSETNENII